MEYHYQVWFYRKEKKYKPGDGPDVCLVTVPADHAVITEDLAKPDGYAQLFYYLVVSATVQLANLFPHGHIQIMGVHRIDKNANKN